MQDAQPMLDIMHESLSGRCNVRLPYLTMLSVTILPYSGSEEREEQEKLADARIEAD